MITADSLLDHIGQRHLVGAEAAPPEIRCRAPRADALGMFPAVHIRAVIAATAAGGSSWTATTCERFRPHSGYWAGVAQHEDCRLVAVLGVGIIPAKINTKVH